MAASMPNSVRHRRSECRRASPSRAADFKQCPLLYRFRAIDRLPELPSRAQVRGTLVHAVLERLYDLPPADRRPAAARALVGSEWARLHHDAPELFDALFAGPGDPALAEWLASAEPLLDTYFRLEDPRRLEPTARELLVETELPSGLLLRGYVDRLDIAAGGQIRIVDDKTGVAPRPVAEARALFQMKFYALVVLHLRGVVPAQLAAVPHRRRVAHVRAGRSAAAPVRAHPRGDLGGDPRRGRRRRVRPNPSRFCEWCSHRPVCPAWGGQPPPTPAGRATPVEETPPTARAERA